MNRKDFRKARVAVNRGVFGLADDEVPGYSAALRLQGQRFDVLQLRTGGFTTDARSRIKVYPMLGARHGR
ncbi:hypothetical protein [Cupriavidus taiwanensis]|uniref:hypothetical protein n=1 Tax=Cupriavidus taiwanensis TaxID=164546 RepID=UPI000E104B11|nr:hypothetical protein [Cupriavidus taiwanensis]SPA50626.1 protein of unknown function [Cupriavidus taiwanensis]